MKIKFARNFFILSTSYLVGKFYLNYERVNPICDNNEKNKYLINNSKYINKEYSPSIYFIFRFMSIIWGNRLDKRCQLEYEREIFYTSDKENIALDWLKSKEENSICIILPGIFGSSNSAYIKPLAKEINNKNFNVVVWNPRGLAIPLINNELFSEKIDNDVKEFCDYICKKYPKKKVYLVGTSLGASIACRYLTNNEIPENIKGYVSISNPYNVYKAAKFATEYKNIIYGNHLSNGMKKLIFLNEKKFKEISEKKNLNIDFDKIKKSKTTFQIDKEFTRKLYPNVYLNEEEYYEKLSCYNNIKKLNVPSLLVNSKNDPISHESLIPIDDIKNNKNIIFLKIKRGGHVEYFNGLKSERWYTKVASEYIKNLDIYLNSKSL